MADLGGIFRASEYLTKKDPLESLRQSMAKHNLLPESIVETGAGQFERFSTKGKSGEKNGYYAFEISGEIGFGCFGDWSRDLHVNWSSVNDSQMSVSDRVLYQQKSEELAKKREQEKKRRYKEARKRAATDLEKALPAVTHNYLIKKDIKSQHDFKINAAGELLIPVYDEDRTVMSYQRIKSDGDKRFMPGGQVSDGMYFISGDSNIVCICEGVATGITINQATGYSVVCAFNAGNLCGVSKLIRKKHTGKIIVCADNDEKTDGNPGVTKGKDAAQVANALFVYPLFTGGVGGTDFNDLAAGYGADEVRQQINVIVAGGLVDINKSNVLDLQKCLEQKPPKRQWLVSGLIPSGKVGAIVGAGGTGKSNFTMLLARIMASGWEIGGFKSPDHRKVLIVNVEDDQDDIWRRINAQIGEHPLKSGELYHLQNNLLVYPGVGIVKPFMRQDGNNPVVTEWAGWLDRSIGNLAPDCVILDTRSRLYGLDENNNDHATQWIGLLESLVTKYGCTFLIIHHVSKSKTGSHDQTSSRGASAFVDNCRFVLSLAGMDDGTAKRYGLSNEKWRYFSVTASKSNYAEGFAPIWFEKRNEGVPVHADLERIMRERVTECIAGWFKEHDGEINKQQAYKGAEGAGLREKVKNDLGLGRDELATWIDELIVTDILNEKSVRFDGAGRPKKVLSINV